MDRLISFDAVAIGIRNAQEEQEAARKALEEENKNVDLHNFNLSKFSGMDADRIVWEAQAKIAAQKLAAAEGKAGSSALGPNSVFNPNKYVTNVRVEERER